MLFSLYYFMDYLGKIHFLFFFISSNVIFFSMHSLGIIGFPRRIFDHSIIYFKFNRLNSFGLIGTSLSISLFFMCVLCIIN
jgi:heme/copper-type cytochrome/quinol oxidase subunit 1